jgi:Tol biopolymer transport system component
MSTARVRALAVCALLLGGCTTTVPDGGTPGASVSVSASPQGTPATSAAVVSTPVETSTLSPSVEPGEAWIAYQWLADGDEDGILLARPDGTGLHQLVPDLPGRQWHPDWSPDGTQLAFIQVNPDDTRELWIVQADGSDPRRLYSCQPPCNNTVLPDWSPADPAAIFVGRDGNLPPDGPPRTFMLSRVDVATGAVTDIVVREDGYAAEQWRISPDGTRAAFTRGDLATDGPSAVFVVDLASGEERRLTAFDWSDNPDWLPDGRIVFSTPGLGRFNEGDAGPANLFAINPDGSGLEQLTGFTDVNTGATQPRVMPDGSGITFTRVGPGRFTRVMAGLSLGDNAVRPLTPTELMGTHAELRPLP